LTRREVLGLGVGAVAAAGSGVTLLTGRRAFAQKKVVVRFATIVKAGGVEEKAMLRFKEALERISGGQFEVQLFLGAVLGKEKEVIDQLSLGETQMNFGGEVPIATWAPDLYPFNVPFTIPSLDLVMNALNGKLGERIRARIAEKKNVLILGYTPRPARRLAAKKPIRTPADVKGLKLRLPEIRDFALAWKALGAIPIAVEGAEQFTALQTGVAEAAENPPSAMWAFRYHEVLSYLMLTDHVYGFRAWSVSKKFYEGLTGPQRDQFNQALKEAMDYHTRLAHEEDREYIDKLVKAGMRSIKVDTKPFQQGVRPALEEIRKDWAPGIFEEFVKPHLS